MSGGKLGGYTQIAIGEYEGAQPSVQVDTLWDGRLKSTGYVAGKFRYDRKRKRKPTTADLKALLKAGFELGRRRLAAKRP